MPTAPARIPVYPCNLCGAASHDAADACPAPVAGPLPPAPTLPQPQRRVRARLAGDARPIAPPANAIVFWSNDAALVARRRHDLRARIRAWEVSWHRSLILSPVDVRMQSAHDRWQAWRIRRETRLAYAYRRALADAFPNAGVSVWVHTPGVPSHVPVIGEFREDLAS
jgi:hypothetical protein